MRDSAHPAAEMRRVAGLAALSLALAAIAFWLDGNVGINIADEGYLWYGSLALKAGAVPVRDFQAYDPGRYVWAALWSCLLGDGLVSLRAACALFSCIGVTCGLLAAQRISSDWRFLAILAIALTQWMIPRFKAFEQSIALIAVYVAVRLLERRSVRAHFGAGIVVGAMAFIGRNHGFYLTIAFGLVILLCARGEWARLPARLAAWSSGVVVGYLPQLAMLALVPGYFEAYVALLRVDLSVGTNLSRQTPWPWLILELPGSAAWWNAVTEGRLFVAVPAFIALAWARVLQSKRDALAAHPLLVATACVALPYAHYIFSRADDIHLAHSVPVLLLGVLAFCKAARPDFRAAIPLAAGLCVVSFAGTFRRTGWWEEWSAPRGRFVERRVRGEVMRLPRKSAVLLDAAEKLARELARPDEAILFAPHLPGLYAATGRFSPVPQIYFIWPASAEEEETLIERLEARDVRWAMVQESKLDGRDEFLFRHTFPRTVQFIESKFERVTWSGVPSQTTIFRRAAPGDGAVQSSTAH